MDNVRIYDTDDYLEMADKIYHKFDVLQSCTIRGWVYDGENAIPKGDLVLKQLEAYDKRYNVNSRNRRKRVKPENSVGDFVAQKIFRWDVRFHEHKPIYNIWRMQ
jgi:hypothetical protein